MTMVLFVQTVDLSFYIVFKRIIANMLAGFLPPERGTRVS
jgi:hypothetical protein